MSLGLPSPMVLEGVSIMVSWEGNRILVQNTQEVIVYIWRKLQGKHFSLNPEKKVRMEQLSWVSIEAMEGI